MPAAKSTRLADPRTIECGRPRRRLARLVLSAAVAFSSASLVMNVSPAPASAAACPGCFVVSAPSIALNVTAQPGQQSVIDQEKGVALYTPLTTGTVGGPGTLWVVGHRTTHGAVFNKVPSLVPGDAIDLIDDSGAYQYIVTRVLVVHEADWSSQVNIHDTSRSTLIMQTSHPERRLRYLVEAVASGITYKPASSPAPAETPAVAPAAPIAPEVPSAPVPAADPRRSVKFGSKPLRTVA